MAIKEFENYVDQANQAAKDNQWEACLQALQQASELMPTDVGVLTGIGTCLIQLGRADEAVLPLQQASNYSPLDGQSLNNLGVAYQLAGNLPAAEQTYRKALALEPQDAQTQKNLAITCLHQDKMTEGINLLVAVLRQNVRDVEALYLLASCYEEGEDVASARHLYSEILKIAPEHPQARQAVERLAEAGDTAHIARPEHAKKLAALKGLRKNGTGAQEASAVQSAVWNNVHSVAFYALPDLNSSLQMDLLSQALSHKGLETKFAEKLESEDLDRYDLFVFSQPNLSGELITGINTCIENGKPFAVDIDQDYFQIPQTHPAYSQFGPGNARALQALEIILSEAQWVCVPSQELADRFRKYARKVEVFLPQWSRDNRLWEKPSPRRVTLNVGWMGSSADRDDFLTIKPQLIKFLRAHPEALLVIAGDPGAYNQFNMLSEARRLYLPATSAEDVPYLLAQLDVILLPTQENLFTAARSDQAVMEAGVRRIPWVASPLRAYREWGAGGILAKDGSQWLAALEQLAANPELRARLGAEGRTKAETRAVSGAV